MSDNNKQVCAYWRCAMCVFFSCVCVKVQISGKKSVLSDAVLRMKTSWKLELKVEFLQKIFAVFSNFSEFLQK